MKHLLGLLMVVLAALSLAATVGGLIGVWAVRQPLADRVTEITGLISRTLSTTAGGLAVVDQSLVTINKNVEAIQSATRAMAEAITTTEPALNGAVRLLKQDLPASIGAIRTALDPAEATAKVVDTFLRGLSRLPLLQVNYDPAVPLDESIRRIAISLNPLPAALVEIGTDLETAQNSLDGIGQGVLDITRQLGQIGPTLTKAKTVVQQYQSELSNYRAMIAPIADNAPPIIDLIAGGLTFILAWLAVLQLMVLAAGWRRLRG